MKGAMILSRISKDEKKQQKEIKKYQRQNVKTPDLLPFVQYKNDCFYMKNGKFADFLKIICQDIPSMSEDEAADINYCFERFYRTYGADIKLIGINMPVDTTKNQKYIKHKLEVSRNPVQTRFLNSELAEEEYAQEVLTQREYYIMFFFDTLEERNDSIETCCRTLGEHFLIDRLNLQEKETLLFTMCNKNVPVDINQLHSAKYPKQEAVDRYVEEQGFDPYLISRIQPQGGIHFKDDKYITAGTGYEACVHIYDYKKNIDNYWLNPILNLGSPASLGNVISVVDISTEDTLKANENLNRSMNEQDSRYSSAKDRKEMLDAQDRLIELQTLYDDINNYEEVIKLIHIRLFISALSKDELEKRVSVVMTRLQGKGFKGTVFLGENANEWNSMFQSYTEQSKNSYSRYGQVVPAHNLAFGNPFIFSSLNDPYGIYFGTTKNSEGIFNFDPFAITSYRTHYNGVIAGVMGMGKSTTLKNLITVQYSLGTYIRGFDVKDEYGTLVKKLGGKMVYLDGIDNDNQSDNHGMINIFDILKTDNTEFGSYTKHISKLKVIYRFLKPGANENELSAFSDCLNKLYKKFNLTSDNGKSITGLAPECYPTMSDLLNVVNEEITNIDKTDNIIHQQLELEKKKWLLNIQTTVKELVSSFGKIFDGHTSIGNIFNEQVVFFNISKIKDMDKRVFSAVVYNAISICWENCVELQTPMKEKYIRGEILWEDIRRYLIVIDESHRIVNAKNDFAVDPIINYEREARHLFAGIWFATQNASDFVPQGSSDNGVQQLQTLFELCQYKFIMKQDSNTMPLLTKIFNQQMTQSEVAAIPHLSKGQGILSIAGDKNIIVNIDVSDERLSIFDGGA